MTAMPRFLRQPVNDPAPPPVPDDRRHDPATAPDLELRVIADMLDAMAQLPKNARARALAYLQQRHETME